MLFKLLFLLTLVFALAACDRPGANTNNGAGTQSPPPGGSAISLSQSIPDSRIFPPKPKPTSFVPCPPVTVDLTDQKVEPSSPGVTGTVAVGQVGPTTDLVADEMTILANVPDGTKYSTTVKLLDKDCKARQDVPLTVAFGLNYRGIVETDPHEAFTCVFRSRADYTSFTVTVSDSATLGEGVRPAIEKKFKEDLLKTFDLQIADAMNRKLRGNSPLPSNSDGRCNWKELDSDGVVRR